jgi:predicted membrane protein
VKTQLRANFVIENLIADNFLYLDRKMKEKTLSIILFVLVTSVFLFSQNSYAEQSAPPTSPLVMAIQKLKIE